ncbi:hypothetical protein V6N13_106189 [Hibiscus sabdariffa]
MGSSVKIKAIRKIILEQRVDIAIIQETKKEILSDNENSSLWYDEDFGYQVSNAVGKSGGLVTVWDKTKFSMEAVSINTNFILIRGKWSEFNDSILVVNAYAPCQANEQAMLWENLSALVNECSNSKVVAGGFNAVRSRGECSGIQAVVTLLICL